MRTFRHDDPGFAAALRSLNRRATPAPHVAEAVAAIIAEARTNGDAALWALNERFGGPAHTPGASLRVTPTEFTAAARAIDARTQHAMAEAHENIRAFAPKGLRHDWHLHNRQGVQVGERFSPCPKLSLGNNGGMS